MATSFSEVVIESLKDFVMLLYPHFCPGCDSTMESHEQVICTECRINLPRTNFKANTGNQIEKLFWGKANVEEATAYLQFHKNSIVMNLLHELKYRGNEDVGELLGRMFGSEFLTGDFFSSVDFIVPVPLHSKRKRQRGYNQCDSICRGISKVTGIETVFGALKRTRSNESQTKKSRFERWTNVLSLFKINNSRIIGKHVLLVDDVITTGSTLESCARVLLDSGCKVSIVAMASPID